MKGFRSLKIQNRNIMHLLRKDLYNKKYYFNYYRSKVMTYFMVNKTLFRFPTQKYLNTVKQGYKDCKLDNKYLIKALKQF